MKYRKRIFVSLFWVFLGIVLNICSLSGLIRDEFWSSMGIVLLVVGALQLIREIRYHSNEEYREKFDTEAKDERNRFIANKASMKFKEAQIRDIQEKLAAAIMEKAGESK